MKLGQLKYAFFTFSLLMTTVPGYSIIAKALLALVLLQSIAIRPLIISRSVLPVILLWGLISVHSVFSDDLLVTLIRVVNSVILIVLLAAFTNSLKINDFIAGGNIAVGIWVVINFIGIFDSSSYDHFGLYNGVTYNANALGGTIALICVPLLLASLFTKRRISLIMIPLIASFIILWLSGSRASLLTLFIVFAFFMKDLYNVSRRSVIYIVTALSLFVLSSFELIVTYLTKFFVKYEHLNNVLASRNQVWGLRAEAITRKPIKGWGYGVNPINVSPELASLYDVNKNEGSTEKGNSYLAVAEEFGIVLGLLLLVILAYAVYRAYLNNKKISLLLVGVLCASLVHAVFESWLFYLGSFNAIWFWLLILILNEPRFGHRPNYN